MFSHLRYGLFLLLCRCVLLPGLVWVFQAVRPDRQPGGGDAPTPPGRRYSLLASEMHEGMRDRATRQLCVARLCAQALTLYMID
jgi:hypothetical protein